MKLTRDEIVIIESRLPFMDCEAGEDRFKMIADFMYNAERLYMWGPQDFLSTITAYDDEGNEALVTWEDGDESVGISSGWIIDGKVVQP